MTFQGGVSDLRNETMHSTLLSTSCPRESKMCVALSLGDCFHNAASHSALPVAWWSGFTKAYWLADVLKFLIQQKQNWIQDLQGHTGFPCLYHQDKHWFSHIEWKAMYESQPLMAHLYKLSCAAIPLRVWHRAFSPSASLQCCMDNSLMRGGGELSCAL